MNVFDIPSVAQVAADLDGVLERFRSQSTFPFSFGDVRPTPGTGLGR